MKRNVALVFVLAVWGMAPWAGAADIGAALAEEFEPIVTEGMAQSFTPGMAMAVAHEGKEVYAKAFGYRDLESKTPMTTDTLFHWASVTKPFVATSVMQLVEAGAIDLDAPASRYVPYFTMGDPRASSITVRQLASHTAGMPDVVNYNWHHPKFDEHALAVYVRTLADDELIAAPGEKRQYSNIGFEVLGAVIAEVSGMSFEAYVASHIFEPLKMTDATLLYTEAPAERRTNSYTATRRGPVERKVWPYNREHAPSSTLIATVHDLARWAMANLNRGELDGARILEDASYDVMWSPTPPATDVGLAWFLREVDGVRVIEHSGGDDGFRTMVVLAPSLDLGVVMAANSDKPNVGAWAHRALTIAMAAATP